MELHEKPLAEIPKGLSWRHISIEQIACTAHFSRCWDPGTFLAGLPMKLSAQEQKYGQCRWRKMKGDVADWLQQWHKFSIPTSNHGHFNVILQLFSPRLYFPRPWGWVMTCVGLKNMIELLRTNSKPSPQEVLYASMFSLLKPCHHHKAQASLLKDPRPCGTELSHPS